MSKVKVSFLIILFSVLSCSEPSMNKNNQQTAEQDDFEQINYELKDSSISKMPYRGRTKVIFVDSLSNKLEFLIKENALETECMSNYNEDLQKSEPPSWTIQSKEIKLINDSLNLIFILELTIELDNSRAHTHKLRDMLFLWTVSYPDNEEKDNPLFDTKKILESRHALFQCVVDSKTSTYESPSTPLDSAVILGRTFYDVLRQDGYENDLSISFNFEYGILAFKDYQNRYWRFSHFSE